MSLPSFLAGLYFITMVMLILMRKRFGNMFMIYGGLTFAYVMCYLSILNVPEGFQGFMLFLAFSLMILNFGLTFAVILKLMKKSDRASRNASIIASILLIVFLFKINVYISYLYIPVLLYKLTDILNVKFVKPVAQTAK